MPCRFANSATDPEDRGVDEEPFLRSTLVIGGAKAYDAAARQYGRPDPARDDRLAEDADGDPSDWWPHGAGSPEYHLLYELDYAGDGEPSAADRETVRTALADLRAALAPHPEGLLFEVGHSRRYFGRYGGAPADRHGALAAADADTDADGADVLLHLAADDALVVVGTEAALWGVADPLELDLGATLDGVLERPQNPPRRRVGIDPTGTASRARDSDAVRVTTLSVDPEAWYVPVDERIEEHVRMHSEDAEASGPVRADGGPRADTDDDGHDDARTDGSREGDDGAGADDGTEACPVDHAGDDGADAGDGDGAGEADGHGGGDEGPPLTPRRGLEGLALPGPTVHLFVPADEARDRDYDRATVESEAVYLTAEAALPAPDAV